VPRALLDFPRLRKAGLREHVHHFPVLTADDGLEAVQSARARDFRQTLEQPCAETTALQPVRDGKPHFRPVRPYWIRVVAGNADKLPRPFRDQDNLTRLIDVDVRAGAGQIEMRRHQETVVEAFCGQALEKPQRLLRIVSPGRAQADSSAVA
jgi:hypothetical protein